MHFNTIKTDRASPTANIIGLTGHLMWKIVPEQEPSNSFVIPKAPKFIVRCCQDLSLILNGLFGSGSEYAVPVAREASTTHVLNTFKP